MKPVRHYGVLITSELVEAFWVLADSPRQAAALAQIAHTNSKAVRHELDRKVRNAEVVREQEMLR
jgi:hypothetical protein